MNQLTEDTMETERGFAALVGETLTAIHGAEARSGRITFETASGKTFALYHEQDCCESVELNDVTGDIGDLIGTPLTMAEEASNSDAPVPGYSESFTWTFYKLATIKAYVTLRWLGESNGYYSESVTFAEIR